MDRTGTKVTVVEQKEVKDYTFRTNIMDLVVECLENGVIPNPKVTIKVKSFSKTLKYQYSSNISVSY